MRIDDFGVDDAGADRLRDMQAKEQEGDEVKNAAHATAYCGRRTRVETMVAMELAASCRPLRKSKTNATMINPART